MGESYESKTLCGKPTKERTQSWLQKEIQDTRNFPAETKSKFDKTCLRRKSVLQENGKIREKKQIFACEKTDEKSATIVIVK